MFRSVLFMALVGMLPACGEDKGDSPLPSEGEGQGEGEGAEGEGPVAEGEGEGEGVVGEGEGEGPVCACVSDEDCDDGNSCNGVETCDCACSLGTPPDCADEFECTEDRCANNECVNVPAHARCGAGKICRPAEGGCVAPPPCRDDADCVLDDACQVGACDAATRACAFAPFDGDEDGYAPIICGGDDCDDSTGAIRPDRDEECNDKDDNCDGEVDDGFDLLTNRANCGGCGNECRPGQQCLNGTCQCHEGLTFCDWNAGCVNTQTDRNYCGQCGIACQEDLGCHGGQCVCLEGLTDCNGQCLDTQENEQHCGRCGNRCSPDFVCRNGSCACPIQDEEYCNDVCTPVLEDMANCGQCGNQCAAYGSECQNGQCVCAWSPDAGRCNDADNVCAICDVRGDRSVPEGFDLVCSITATDEMNCGRCGNPCPNGSECQNGECGNCALPWSDIVGDECNGSCVVCDGMADMTFNGSDLVCTLTATDSMNCGECGNRCPYGSEGFEFGTECQNGQCNDCAQSWDFEQCDENCVVCDGMADVVEGFDRACSITATDPLNCGLCGNRCIAGAECQNGQCSDCAWNWSFSDECNGDCVICDGMADVLAVDRVCSITATDEYNCGRCGNRCILGSECQNGQCSECVLDWHADGAECNGNCTVCDGMADLFSVDRVCSITATDEYNCGRCGNRCADGEQCVEGRCTN